MMADACGTAQPFELKAPRLMPYHLGLHSLPTPCRLKGALNVSALVGQQAARTGTLSAPSAFVL